MSKSSKKFQAKPQFEQSSSAKVVAATDVFVTTPANTVQITRLEKIMTFLNYGIFLQAMVATLGSLYYSTYGDPVVNFVAGNFFPYSGGFTPCELCWFARILMYPIFPMSAVALAKEDRRFTDYVLPLTLPGIALEFYHYGLQMWDFPNPFRCTAANPCSALQVNYFGFVTIPFLCLTAFVIITVLSLGIIWANRKVNQLKAGK